MAFRSRISNTNNSNNININSEPNISNNKKSVNISIEEYEDLSESQSGVQSSSSQPLKSILRQESRTLSSLSSEESGIESTESDSLLRGKSDKRFHKKYLLFIYFHSFIISIFLFKSIFQIFKSIKG